MTEIATYLMTLISIDKLLLMYYLKQFSINLKSSPVMVTELLAHLLKKKDHLTEVANKRNKRGQKCVEK